MRERSSANSNVSFCLASPALAALLRPERDERIHTGSKCLDVERRDRQSRLLRNRFPGFAGNLSAQDIQSPTAGLQ